MWWRLFWLNILYNINRYFDGRIDKQSQDFGRFSCINGRTHTHTPPSHPTPIWDPARHQSKGLHVTKSHCSENRSQQLTVWALIKQCFKESLEVLSIRLTPLGRLVAEERTNNQCWLGRLSWECLGRNIWTLLETSVCIILWKNRD